MLQHNIPSPAAAQGGLDAGDVTRPQAVAHAISACVNAMRTAESELGKLIALRDGAKTFALLDMLDAGVRLGDDAKRGDFVVLPDAPASEAAKAAKQTKQAKQAPPFAYVEIATEIIPPRAWAVAPETRGRLFAIELKSDRGRLSPEQIECHRGLRDADATVGTANSIDDALSLLDTWGILPGGAS
jgi:hypothetical protein